MEPQKNRLADIAQWPADKLYYDAEAISLLVRALAAEDTGARDIALQALARLRGCSYWVTLTPETEAELARQLRSSSDPQVRALAATLVTYTKSALSQQALLGALIDEVQEVREAAATALRQRCDETTYLEAVKKAAEENSGEQRVAALEALPHSASAVGCQWLARFTEDPHRAVRWRAAKLIHECFEWINARAETRFTYGEAFLQVTAEVLTEDKDPHARWHAASYLEGASDERSITALLRGTMDTDPDVQNACARSLAACPCTYERVRDAGLRLLGDNLSAALELLAPHAAEALAEVLAVLQHEPEQAVVMDVLSWLGQHGKVRAWPTIRRWVTATDAQLASWVEVTDPRLTSAEVTASVRATAIHAAAFVGPHARELIPLLCQCTSQKDFFDGALAGGYASRDPVIGIRSAGPAGLAVVEALAAIGAASPLVRHALRSAYVRGIESPRLREVVLQCLHKLHAFDEQTIEVLLLGLRDELDTVRETAKEILYLSGAALSGPIAACRSRAELQPAVLEALWLAGDPPDDAVVELARRLGEEEPRRSEALSGLRQLGDRAAVAYSVLRQLAESGEKEARCAAFTALGPLDQAMDAPLTKAWLDALADPSVDLRVAATAALGEREQLTAELRQALAQRITDEDPRVRDAARWAIARHDGGVPREAAAQPAERVNELACQILDRSPYTNSVCSPLSLYLALAALERGASGQTREALQKLVGSSAAAMDMRRSLPLPDDQAGFAFGTATGLFVDQEYPLAEDYRKTFVQELGGHLERLDLAHPGACDHMNQWIHARTTGRIPVLFHRLPPQTRFVLANATYFKARWTHPFLMGPPGMTMTFHGLDGRCAEVPAMSAWLACRYAQGPWCAAVELEYRPGRTSMVLVVPQLGFFARVRSMVSDGALPALLENLQPTSLSLTLPKLELSFTLRLHPLLRDLGLGEVLDRADWSRMTPVRDQGARCEIIHRSFIRVDEQGTEAAAATGIGGVAGIPPPPLLVDRPFLFFIRDCVSQTILFCGQLLMPPGDSSG